LEVGGLVVGRGSRRVSVTHEEMQAVYSYK
jgi:hypothetical protein